MIRGFLQIVTRTIRPYSLPTTALLFTTPRFSFARVSLHPTIQKIQSGVDSKAVISLLSDLSALNDKEKEQAFQLILEGFDKKKIAADLLTDPKLSTLAEKYPQLYIEIKQREIQITEIDLLQKIWRGRMNNSNMSAYLDTFVRILQQWASKLPELKDEKRTFFYSVHLNRSHTYLFEKYISKHLPEEKKETAYRELCQWNRKLAKPMRQILQKARLEIVQMKKKGQVDQDFKNYFHQNLQAFTSNILFTYQGRNQVFLRNKNEQQFSEAKKELIDNVDFVLKCYQILGFQDLQYFTLNFIQLNRIKTFILFSQHQLTNIENPNEFQSKKITLFINEQMDLLCGTILNSFQQIKNKEKDINRLIQVTMPVLGLRIDQAKMTVRKYKDFEEELGKYKEQILSKVENSITRKILAEKFEIQILKHLKQMKGQLK